MHAYIIKNVKNRREYIIKYIRVPDFWSFTGYLRSLMLKRKGTMLKAVCMHATRASRCCPFCIGWVKTVDIESFLVWTCSYTTNINAYEKYKEQKENTQFSKSWFHETTILSLPLFDSIESPFITNLVSELWYVGFMNPEYWSRRFRWQAVVSH